MRFQSKIALWVAVILLAGACSQKGEEKMQEMKAEGLWARAGESVFLGGSDERVGQVENIEKEKKGVRINLKLDEPMEMVFSSVIRDEARSGLRIIPSKMKAKRPVSTVEIRTALTGDFGKEIVLPYEIRGLIDEDMLFLMAETAPLGGNYLFLLKRNGDVYKLETPLPPEGRLFTGKPEKIITAEPKRLSAFMAFLDEFTRNHQDSFWSTPEDLDVQGGTVLFVFFRTEGKEHSFRMEPEIPERKEVIGAFDLLLDE
ncbi:MAG TPA: hypothetical protein ENN72_05240 [Firmicutes bacterium]|nr:hypothetical protein [Bacillota bacterium]